MSTSTVMRLGAWACAAALLAGCGDSDVQAVHRWMKETEAAAPHKVPPLSPPKTFIPFSYTAREAVDPFSPNKLLVELAKAAATGNNPYRPDLERRKELLESFPLDTMRMVGVLQKGGANYALLQIDRAVYQVKVGQHVGQNYGLVTSVTENAVNIREVVQDAAGEWTERMAKLELQDSKERK
jgi:type IV pilus assembly protein PilP